MYNICLWRLHFRVVAASEKPFIYISAIYMEKLAGKCLTLTKCIPCRYHPNVYKFELI